MLKKRYECLLRAELHAMEARWNELIIFVDDIYTHLLGRMRLTSRSRKY